MATYQSELVANGPVYNEVGPKIRKATYSITAAIAGGTNVIEMIPVYAGETVVDVTLMSTDLDTNGSPAIDLNVGDAADVDRFITTSTVGQAGGVARLNDNVGHVYTADDTLDINIETAAATGAAGTLTLVATLI